MSPEQKVIIDLAETSESENKKFGTFLGVYRPTLLTIIGVMLYLREGWLVGNAGLVGAILVILTAFFITGTTALSISSITSNIRVGSGGVFSLVSQSLGLEMGGAIGIPLYLAQGLSAALYMHGFVEGWIYLMPEHKDYVHIIILSLFTVAFLLVYISTKLAFRIQLLVMALIISALVSMYFGVRHNTEWHKPEVFGQFTDGSFWELFAVFFPAATGIMVGASMSGSLKNPKQSIPLGTLGAWLTSLIIYILGAVYYSLSASPEDLIANKTIGIQTAFWPIVVLIGLMASCFTATLSSLAAAPRVLQALAIHKIVPGSEWAAKEHKGEPRHAMIFTGVMVLLAALAGDLNNLARILTMFFLLTYFTINIVLVIEQSLNLISFRPEFKIPKFVPILGSIACLTAIIIISPVFGLLAIAIIFFIYAFLDKKQLETPWETVHSGLFVSIANWAAKKVVESGISTPKRAWKPDIMVPVEKDTQFEGQFRLLKALCATQGSIQAVGFVYKDQESKIGNLESLVKDMQKEDIFASSSIIEALQFESGLRATVSIMKGSFFHPNTIFETINRRSQDELQGLVNISKENGMGVVLLAQHKDSGLGREKSINLWVRDQSPDWRIGMELTNLDYALLLSYQLKKNWNADVRLLCVVEEKENKEIAEEFLMSLMDVTRMSKNIKIHVHHGKFMEFLSRAPRADLNVFGISSEVNKDSMLTLVETSRSSCLFVMDSGNESALA